MVTRTSNGFAKPSLEIPVAPVLGTVHQGKEA